MDIIPTITSAAGTLVSGTNGTLGLLDRWRKRKTRAYASWLEETIANLTEGRAGCNVVSVPPEEREFANRAVEEGHLARSPYFPGHVMLPYGSLGSS